ncbi:hypothetical protein V6R21_03635 [Limibacter armeniacum]|uniref:hypothetical protein n=1 Tax=Limibacter armeniacum TaxID=466084 RepID=UPI002FE5097C
MSLKNRLTYELKDESGTVYYRAEYKHNSEVLIVTWLERLLSDELLLSGSKQSLEIIDTLKIKYLINDTSRYPIGWFGILEWYEKEWLPTAEVLGLKLGAIIMSFNFFGQLSAEEVKNICLKHNSPIQLRLFLSKREAETWIDSMRNKTN